jgi:hypothetical protein
LRVKPCLLFGGYWGYSRGDYGGREHWLIGVPLLIVVLVVLFGGGYYGTQL